MRQGKLTNTKLNELVIDKLEPKNAETVVGAGVGEDCCAVKTGDLCVVSTDPITAGGEKTGALAIHINANDIAAAGAVPIAALVTLLIPPSGTEDEIEKLMRQITATARELKIDIIGGHTEVTDSVNRTVVSVTMIGRPVIAGRMFRTSDMNPGDDIIMTKYAGIEGTAIIAADFAGEIKFSEEEKRELDLISESLSVVTDGRIAAETTGVSAMHDITEGGILGALSEMCEASGTGAEIDLSKIPVLEVTRKICNRFNLDVYGLISSGSMLIAAKDGAALKKRLNEAEIPATIIGKAGESGIFDLSTGKRMPITPYPADQLYCVPKRTL